MKTLITISFISLLCVTLCSCPYSSPFKLDDAPNMYVEEQYLGKWATFVKQTRTEREEPVKLILSKKNDMEYNIAFTGYLDELQPYHVIKGDSIKGTAFMSTIGNKQLLNITILSKVYIAEIKLKDNKLYLLPLVEHFTSKMIFNNAVLRKSVEVHYSTRVRPMYDDDFCLKEMVKVN